MRKLRLHRAPLRLDVPGDWPAYPILPREGGWKVSRLLAKLFPRRGRRRESPVR